MNLFTLETANKIANTLRADVNASGYIFHEVRITPNGTVTRFDTPCTCAEAAATALEIRMIKLINKGFDMKACAGIEPGMSGWNSKYKVSVWVEVQRNKSHTVPCSSAPVVETAPALVAVEDGIYTVVDRDKYRTVRIKTCKSGTFDGKRIIELLVGSDNDNDYKGFGFVNAHGITLWKKYQDSAAFSWIVNTLLQDPLAAGECYALRSGKCCKCNRTLTVPASLSRGMGSECAKKYYH